MLKDNLIALRSLKGLSQEEAANAAGISRQAYAKWEKGETSPDIEKCSVIAKFYGVSLDDLVNFESPSENAAIPPGPKGKHLFGTVAIGERGQIVIPKEARDLFDLKSGTKLVVLGDDDEGLALIKASDFEEKLRIAMSYAKGETK